jgi:hypothetical protein
MLANLVSKVIAAGLAAGVFLLWWPAHLPSTGVQWLVLRGLAWTLAFEVLVLCFVPLEGMATRALRRRRESRASRVRRRLAAAPAPARAGGAVMLAFTGLLLPGLLLLHSGRLPTAQPAAHTTKVVRKVVVRKVVHERTVVVREPAPAAAAAALAPYAASAAPVAKAPKAVAAAPARKKTATPTRTSTETAAKKATSTPTTSTPATTTTPTLPDPAAAAAPASSDAAAAADTTPAAG